MLLQHSRSIGLISTVVGLGISLFAAPVSGQEAGRVSCRVEDARTGRALGSGAYRRVTEPVLTIRTRNRLVARQDLPAAVVDHVLDVLADRREALVQVHERARQITISDLNRAPIRLRPATEAWMARRGG